VKTLHDETPVDQAYSLRDELLKSRLLSGVPATLVSAVVSGCETRELSTGDVLLKAGSENDVLYVVLSGRVSVHLGEAERPHVRLGPGECVGELSLLDGGSVSADVTADEPTLLLALDRDELWSLIDSCPEVARNLLRVLAGRVRADDTVLAESNRQKAQLERLATVDALTGLRNRRWLDDAFARHIVRATRTSQPASLLMIDIDHFKRLNDEHGHAAGDGVLRRVAQAFASSLRPVDLLARYGGEEFAVLLPGLDLQAAFAVAERLRQAVGNERPTTWPPVTVSIGVASLRAGETFARLLTRADEALYRAKESGRNQTSV
jgi:diguanylate cyclase (GGDEF)-like protein